MAPGPMGLGSRKVGREVKENKTKFKDVVGRRYNLDEMRGPEGEVKSLDEVVSITSGLSTSFGNLADKAESMRLTNERDYARDLRERRMERPVQKVTPEERIEKGLMRNTELKVEEWMRDNKISEKKLGQALRKLTPNDKIRFELMKDATIEKMNEQVFDKMVDHLENQDRISAKMTATLFKTLPRGLANESFFDDGENYNIMLKGKNGSIVHFKINKENSNRGTEVDVLNMKNPETMIKMAILDSVMKGYGNAHVFNPFVDQSKAKEFNPFVNLSKFTKIDMNQKGHYDILKSMLGL